MNARTARKSPSPLGDGNPEGTNSKTKDWLWRVDAVAGLLDDCPTPREASPELNRTRPEVVQNEWSHSCRSASMTWVRREIDLS